MERALDSGTKCHDSSHSSDVSHQCGLGKVPLPLGASVSPLCTEESQGWGALPAPLQCCLFLIPELVFNSVWGLGREEDLYPAQGQMSALLGAGRFDARSKEAARELGILESFVESSGLTFIRGWESAGCHDYGKQHLSSRSLISRNRAGRP